MALEKNDYKAIENYLKNNLARIVSEQSLGKPPVVYEIELRERMVRVEEELKNQRELMNRGFDMMDKRFELVEKRFEQIDRRFDEVNRRFDEVNKRLFQFMVWSFGLTVSAAGVIIAVMKM